MEILRIKVVENYKNKEIGMKRNAWGLLWGEASLKISAILYSSVITAFLLQSGLKNTEIGILWSVVLFSQMLFDYPTGSFSDKYGRLKIFMIGMLFMGVAMILIASNLGKEMLYFSSVLLGIGESQVSGTLFPWFVNTLNTEDSQEKKKDILKMNAQQQSFVNVIGIATGFLLSGFNLSYATVLFVAGGLQILNGVFVYLVFQDNKSTETDLIHIGKKSVIIFCKEKKLWYYTLAMTAYYSFYSIYLFIWQPVANSFHITGSKLGKVHSFYLFALALSSFLIKYQKELKKEIYILGAFLVPLSLIGLYQARNLYFYLSALFILGLSNGLLIPKLMGTIHYYIPDEVRSSVVSLVSSLSSIALIFLQVIIGKILDQKGGVSFQILCFILGTIFILCIYEIQKNLNDRKGTKEEL